MTSYSTRTEEFGKITFIAPNATAIRDGYVWIETERGHASGDRRQICHGGDFKGSTVTATELTLKYTAQKWLRQRRELKREESL